MVQEIGGSYAAAYVAAGQRDSSAEADLGELSISKIVKQQRPLGVGHAEGMLIHLGIHVAVGDKNVGPAIVVEIKKLYPKTEEGDADWSKAGTSRQVSELAVVVVVIDVVGVVGKIGFCNVG